MSFKITLWLTGLSGSGKSTIANRFIKEYSDFVLLDGDVLRQGICSDLGFSIEDRQENLRRLIEICKLFNANGKNVITAFISPLEKMRVKAKEEIDNCKIIYCDSSLETCEKRDVKGLYKKARQGIIKNFTGIGSIYEIPKKPDLMLDTKNKSIKECYDEISMFYWKMGNFS